MVSVSRSLPSGASTGRTLSWLCDTVDHVQFWRSGYKLSMGGAPVPISFGPADFLLCKNVMALYGVNYHVFSDGGSVVKNPPVKAGDEGDVGLILGLGRSPGGGNGSTPVFLPGESHRQRSLAGYSPQGCKESDTTERLSMSSDEHKDGF